MAKAAAKMPRSVEVRLPVRLRIICVGYRRRPLLRCVTPLVVLLLVR
jgi:hypothetical protein